MLPVPPDAVSRCPTGVGRDNAVGGLSVFRYVCAGVGCKEWEEGEVGDCALDIWWGVWYVRNVRLWGLMVVLGMKEFYGGGLFVRESNNTVIFVRSSYRVFLYFEMRTDDSWVLLDG